MSISIPSAWITFLLAANSYSMTMNIEDAINAFGGDLTEHEMSEMKVFLNQITTLSENQCQELISHEDEVVNSNLFRPDNCEGFYREVQKILFG